MLWITCGFCYMPLSCEDPSWPIVDCRKLLLKQIHDTALTQQIMTRMNEPLGIIIQGKCWWMLDRWIQARGLHRAWRFNNWGFVARKWGNNTWNLGKSLIIHMSATLHYNTKLICTHSIKYISPCSVKAISQLLGNIPNSSCILSISSRLRCSSSSTGAAFNVVAVMVDLLRALFPDDDGLAPGRWSLGGGFFGGGMPSVGGPSLGSSVWCGWGCCCCFGGCIGGLGVP